MALRGSARSVENREEILQLPQSNRYRPGSPHCPHDRGEPTRAAPRVRLNLKLKLRPPVPSASIRRDLSRRGDLL